MLKPIQIHIMMNEMMLNGLFMSRYMTKPMFLALHTVRLSLISACVSAKTVERNLSALYEKLKGFLYADSEDWSDLADTKADSSLR